MRGGSWRGGQHWKETDTTVLRGALGTGSVPRLLCSAGADAQHPARIPRSRLARGSAASQPASAAGAAPIHRPTSLEPHSIDTGSKRSSHGPGLLGVTRWSKVTALPCSAGQELGPEERVQQPQSLPLPDRGFAIRSQRAVI